jgi:ribosomal protein S18 acetylase RimI-like enzyme
MASPKPTKGEQVVRQIRHSGQRDRDAVMKLLEATGFFRDDELVVAAEVLDEAIAKGPDGHYQSYVADENGTPVGWVCFGPTPCTIGTFDLYWIGVSPERQGCGVGAALTRFAEAEVLKRGGRLMIIETSGRPIYESTRGFYLKLGYHEAARIADFYAPDDAKVVYAKALAPAAEAAR